MHAVSQADFTRWVATLVAQSASLYLLCFSFPMKQADDLKAFRSPLAYENKKFLDSPDGRILRILAEYSEPLARFRREKIQDTVVFFGSARFKALDVAEGKLHLLDKP